MSAVIAIASIFCALRIGIQVAKQTERQIKNQRGRPAKIMDAFCIGDTVKVMAVSKDKLYAVLKEYYGTKLVKLTEATELVVGKHYQLTEHGKLLDLIRDEKPERDPELENA
ncbi:hypothetical protein KW799_00400 [Candidatus Parcubacteria bacterium]|nr:hypothetical protein [Candidatus Parcubacteria bacterium]